MARYGNRSRIRRVNRTLVALDPLYLADNNVNRFDQSKKSMEQPSIRDD